MLAVDPRQKDLHILPRNPFHRAVWVAVKMTWSGIEVTGYTRHYRFILRLGNFMFAQVKTLRECDIVFNLIGTSICFRDRTAHGESAGFHPDHFPGLRCCLDQRHGWVERVRKHLTVKS